MVATFSYAIADTETSVVVNKILWSPDANPHWAPPKGTEAHLCTTEVEIGWKWDGVTFHPWEDPDMLDAAVKRCVTWLEKEYSTTAVNVYLGATTLESLRQATLTAILDVVKAENIAAAEA